MACFSDEKLLDQTVKTFKRDPDVQKLHTVTQKRYSVFSTTRTSDLYFKFFELVGGVPDFSESEYKSSFIARVPFPGRGNERPVEGMAKDGKIHGLVRYEYKGNIIEETRVDGKVHGLRVCFVQTGDIWIRLHSHGERIAQIVLGSDCSINSNPSPIDEGGLAVLKSHLHLITECLLGKAE
jgi:hypothetical protein